MTDELSEDIQGIRSDDANGSDIGESDASTASQLTVVLQDGLAAIGDMIQQVQKDFQTKIQYDQSKERTIDTLHRQLQDYKEDLALKLLRPLVTDLITLYDDIDQLVPRTARDAESPDPVISQIVSNIETMRVEIEEMLNRNGVESFTLEGEVFDGAQQRAQQVVATDVPALDRHVAEHRRKGFRYEDKILRPEVVAVFRFTPPAQ